MTFWRHRSGILVISVQVPPVIFGVWFILFCSKQCYWRVTFWRHFSQLGVLTDESHAESQLSTYTTVRQCMWEPTPSPVCVVTSRHVETIYLACRKQHSATPRDGVPTLYGIAIHSNPWRIADRGDMHGSKPDSRPDCAPDPLSTTFSNSVWNNFGIRSFND